MVEFTLARTLVYIFAFLLSYLLGGVMFGLVLTKLAGLGDPRAIGSGNLGATNVLRTGRKDIAAATLIFDALKGTFAVLLAKAWGLDMAVFAALGVFLGHLYPLWLKFQGGKGVATYLGILLALTLPGSLIFAACWLCAAFATRYSSVAAMAACAITPVAVFISGQPVTAMLFGILSVLLILRHRENINRLMRGEESKIKLS